MTSKKKQILHTLIIGQEVTGIAASRYVFNSLQLEPDALGQGQGGAVIDGVGLPAHIAFPGV
jgi:hypothetical protein